MKYMLTVLACGLAISSQSFAGIWGSWAAGGTACSDRNVSVIDNGSSLSVLFDEFGLNMPEDDVGDGLSARKSCTFRIQLTPPKGFYLAGFKQVYSGGIIKSRRSSAQLNIRYNIGTVRGTRYRLCSAMATTSVRKTATHCSLVPMTTTSRS